MKVTIEWENGQKHVCEMPRPNFMVDNIERKMISKILIESGPPLSLTDDEIIEQANHLADGWFSDKFEKGIFITEEKLVELVKAILRKAQEK